MICQECKAELTEEEERVEELKDIRMCVRCYRSLIDYLVFFKMESKYE